MLHTHVEVFTQGCSKLKTYHFVKALTTTTLRTCFRWIVWWIISDRIVLCWKERLLMKSLHWNAVNILEAALKSLAQGCPLLQAFRIPFVKGSTTHFVTIPSTAVKHLGDHCLKLAFISWAYSDISDDVLVELGKSKSLKVWIFLNVKTSQMQVSTLWSKSMAAAWNALTCIVAEIWLMPVCPASGNTVLICKRLQKVDIVITWQQKESCNWFAHAKSSLIVTWLILMLSAIMIVLIFVKFLIFCVIEEKHQAARKQTLALWYDWMFVIDVLGTSSCCCTEWLSTKAGPSQYRCSV